MCASKVIAIETTNKTRIRSTMKPMICVQLECLHPTKHCGHRSVHTNTSGLPECAYSWCIGKCKPVSELTESDRAILALRNL